MYPTAYFRYERRDTEAPTMVLQQWWTEDFLAKELLTPEQCGVGEWRDVPIVMPQGVII
jgi:hypothetical protein